MEKNFDLALVGEDELEGVAVYVIDGTPKTESDNPQLKVIAEQMGRQRIYLGQEDGFARKIETYAKDGQTLVMSMQFKNLKFNEELADSLFAFTPPEGVPVLEGVLAHIECERWALHDAGDHTIVVGRVEACDAGEGPPLAYHRGRYARVEES